MPRRYITTGEQQAIIDLLLGCRSHSVCVEKLLFTPIHLGLSWKYQKLRPGSWTGLLLLLPLSVWVYALGYTQHILALHEFLMSGAIGLAISVWLLWMTVMEFQNSTTSN
jgi:hypothetical protein